MDYHSLPRRQLQLLCKKHGIPANSTNVEMADALCALLKKPQVLDEIGRSSRIVQKNDKIMEIPSKPATRRRGDVSSQANLSSNVEKHSGKEELEAEFASKGQTVKMESRSPQGKTLLKPRSTGIVLRKGKVKVRSPGSRSVSPKSKGKVVWTEPEEEICHKDKVKQLQAPRKKGAVTFSENVEIRYKEAELHTENGSNVTTPSSAAERRTRSGRIIANGDPKGELQGAGRNPHLTLNSPATVPLTEKVISTRSGLHKVLSENKTEELARHHKKGPNVIENQNSKESAVSHQNARRLRSNRKRHNSGDSRVQDGADKGSAFCGSETKCEEEEGKEKLRRSRRLTLAGTDIKFNQNSVVDSTKTNSPTEEHQPDFRVDSMDLGAEQSTSTENLRRSRRLTLATSEIKLFQTKAIAVEQESHDSSNLEHPREQKVTNSVSEVTNKMSLRRLKTEEDSQKSPKLAKNVSAKMKTAALSEGCSNTKLRNVAKPTNVTMSRNSKTASSTCDKPKDEKFSNPRMGRSSRNKKGYMEPLKKGQAKLAANHAATQAKVNKSEPRTGRSLRNNATQKVSEKITDSISDNQDVKVTEIVDKKGTLSSPEPKLPEPHTTTESCDNSKSGLGISEGSCTMSIKDAEFLNSCQADSIKDAELLNSCQTDNVTLMPENLDGLRNCSDMTLPEDSLVIYLDDLDASPSDQPVATEKNSLTEHLEDANGSTHESTGGSGMSKADTTEIVEDLAEKYVSTDDSGTFKADVTEIVEDAAEKLVLLASEETGGSAREDTNTEEIKMDCEKDVQQIETMGQIEEQESCNAIIASPKDMEEVETEGDYSDEEDYYSSEYEGVEEGEEEECQEHISGTEEEFCKENGSLDLQVSSCTQEDKFSDTEKDYSSEGESDKGDSLSEWEEDSASDAEECDLEEDWDIQDYDAAENQDKDASGIEICETEIMDREAGESGDIPFESMTEGSNVVFEKTKYEGETSLEISSVAADFTKSNEYNTVANSVYLQWEESWSSAEAAATGPTTTEADMPAVNQREKNEGEEVLIDASVLDQCGSDMKAKSPVEGSTGLTASLTKQAAASLPEMLQLMKDNPIKERYTEGGDECPVEVATTQMSDSGMSNNANDSWKLEADEASADVIVQTDEAPLEFMHANMVQEEETEQPDMETPENCNVVQEAEDENQANSKGLKESSALEQNPDNMEEEVLEGGICAQNVDTLNSSSDVSEGADALLTVLMQSDSGPLELTNIVQHQKSPDQVTLMDGQDEIEIVDAKSGLAVHKIVETPDKLSLMKNDVQETITEQVTNKSVQLPTCVENAGIETEYCEGLDQPDDSNATHSLAGIRGGCSRDMEERGDQIAESVDERLNFTADEVEELKGQTKKESTTDVYGGIDLLRIEGLDNAREENSSEINPSAQLFSAESNNGPVVKDDLLAAEGIDNVKEKDVPVTNTSAKPIMFLSIPESNDVPLGKNDLTEDVDAPERLQSVNTDCFSAAPSAILDSMEPTDKSAVLESLDPIDLKAEMEEEIHAADVNSHYQPDMCGGPSEEKTDVYEESKLLLNEGLGAMKEEMEDEIDAADVNNHYQSDVCGGPCEDKTDVYDEPKLLLNVGLGVQDMEVEMKDEGVVVQSSANKIDEVVCVNTEGLNEDLSDETQAGSTLINNGQEAYLQEITKEDSLSDYPVKEEDGINQVSMSAIQADHGETESETSLETSKITEDQGETEREASQETAKIIDDYGETGTKTSPETGKITEGLIEDQGQNNLEVLGEDKVQEASHSHEMTADFSLVECIAEDVPVGTMSTTVQEFWSKEIPVEKFYKLAIKDKAILQVPEAQDHAANLVLEEEATQSFESEEEIQIEKVGSEALGCLVRAESTDLALAEIVYGDVPEQKDEVDSTTIAPIENVHEKSQQQHDLNRVICKENELSTKKPSNKNMAYPARHLASASKRSALKALPSNIRHTPSTASRTPSTKVHQTPRPRNLLSTYEDLASPQPHVAASSPQPHVAASSPQPPRSSKRELARSHLR